VYEYDVAKSCDLTESKGSYREFVTELQEENAREIQRHPRCSISGLDCEVNAHLVYPEDCHARSFHEGYVEQCGSSSVDQRIHVRQDHYSGSERTRSSTSLPNLDNTVNATKCGHHNYAFKSVNTDDTSHRQTSTP